MNKGILTIAYGGYIYIRRAKALARSLRIYGIDVFLAIVTDCNNSDFDKLYDIVIPLNPKYGEGYEQKLYLDQYSPFTQTLYLDSDCLVVKNIDFVWEAFSQSSFGVVGSLKTQGSAFSGSIPDISKIINNFDLEHLPIFNGCCYFFKQDEQAHKIFNEARILIRQYDELGLSLLNNKINDEPIFSIVLGLNTIKPIADPNGYIVRTAAQDMRWLEIDVLQGICKFYHKNKLQEPVIVHLCCDFSLFKYARERFKLLLFEKFPAVRKTMISTFCNLIFSFLYISKALNLYLSFFLSNRQID
jgi:hypothetical protein